MLKCSKTFKQDIMTLGLNEDQAEYVVELINDTELLNDDPHAKERIRECWHRPSEVDLIMHVLNAMIKAHGVEGYSPSSRSFMSPPLIEYLNMGDPYVATVIYNNEEQLFYVGCWGDVVEQMMAEE